MEKRKEKVIMKYLLTFESYTFEDFTYSDMEDVKELLEEGHSAEQIAIELDFSLDKVKQIIYSLKKSGQISDSNLSEKKAYKGAKGGLDKWFREKWVDISKTNADGSHPPFCRDDADKGGYPKCRKVRVAARMTKKDKTKSVNRKRKVEKEGSKGSGRKPNYAK